MAFVLKQSDTYSWPVSFEIPVDGGRHEKQTFDAVFKRMPQKWVREVAKKIDDNAISDIEVVKQVLVGWADVKGSDEKDLPFSGKALDELLEIPTAAGSIALTYFNSISGAKEKN